MRIEGLENINESLSTHYLIYKIINNINGKYYIGQHQTNNIFDNYQGSGYLLPIAYSKYGIENFTKIILFDFDNFDDMNNKEYELVQLSSCWPANQMSYNLTVGGHRRILPAEIEAMRILHVKETWKNKTDNEKLKYSRLKHEQTIGKNNPMYGKNARDFMTSNAIKQMDMKRKNTWKTKTKEELKIKEQKRQRSLNARTDTEKRKTHELLSRASSGKNNPMYGSTFTWMVNHKLHKRIRADKSKIDDYLKFGYQIGYKFNLN